ncbi:MAG: adenylate kinase [Candidatus Pacearchaeota archaeon]
MRLIIIGPQGSGKGTQAKIISEKLKIPHISTGDLFRNIKGSLKEKIEYYINKGELVPDELTIKLLKQRINQSDSKKGFILDGFPRNIAQAKALEKITKIDKVIEIYLNDDKAVERISSRLSCKKCGAVYNTITNPPKKQDFCDKCNEKLYKRKDDNPEEIKKRLDIYHKETEPILKIYENILIKINGDQEINKITEEILKKIKE